MGSVDKLLNITIKKRHIPPSLNNINYFLIKKSLDFF